MNVAIRQPQNEGVLIRRSSLNSETSLDEELCGRCDQHALANPDTLELHLQSPRTGLFVDDEMLLIPSVHRSQFLTANLLRLKITVGVAKRILGIECILEIEGKKSLGVEACRAERTQKLLLLLSEFGDALRDVSSARKLDCFGDEI